MGGVEHVKLKVDMRCTKKGITGRGDAIVKLESCTGCGKVDSYVRKHPENDSRPTTHACRREIVAMTEVVTQRHTHSAFWLHSCTTTAVAKE